MNDKPARTPESVGSRDMLMTTFEPIPPAVNGRYVFISEWEALRTALSKFGPRPINPAARSKWRKGLGSKHTTIKPPRKASPVPLRIVIYPDRVKFGATISSSFIESILPTVGAIEGFAERSEPVGFVFDLNVLLRAASSIQNDGLFTTPDGRTVRAKGLRFEYEPVDSQGPNGTPVLRIKNINLSTLQHDDFDNFVHTLGETKPVGTFNPRVLYKGLYHARLFAKMKCEDRRLTVIEIRGGAVLGADLTGMCMFEAPCLAGSPRVFR
jgi:hypothetical protein